MGTFDGVLAGADEEQAVAMAARALEWAAVAERTAVMLRRHDQREVAAHWDEIAKGWRKLAAAEYAWLSRKRG